MRIGTRGSALALAQSEHVRALLSERGDRHELVRIATTGDRDQDTSLSKFAGKGIFTKEIEAALLDGRIDLAVHSLKDLPTEETPGLTIGALLPREDPQDALVARGGLRFDALPRGARVGTSSLRRRSQLLAKRPDLEVLDLRGNVPTRIARLEAGLFDAIVLAMAGLRRLGMAAEATDRFDEETMLPAPGQGIVAVQIRSDDPATAEAVRRIHDAVSEAEGTAERVFLEGLGGGCLVPVGARATAREGRLRLSGYVGDPGGSPWIRRAVEGDSGEAASLGRQLAGEMLAEGAKPILDKVRGSGEPAPDRVLP
ncbi:MAG TPA: hydroxymethylbilane synthase [Candidatus Eisenbacteria bacterium]|nr:hydroxymethylbilane synthase [Candidatus Eisenbacteria bacterium]